MNVTVENLGACKKLLRVELDANEVEAGFGSVVADLQRRARLPGFRPGKSPRQLIERAFAADIEEQVKGKLLPEAYQRAIKEQKLRPVGDIHVEEVQFARGKPMQFAITLETEPEFELPDYKGLPVRLDARVVTEEDCERAMQVLREQRPQYRDVARPVQRGDFVVVNYAGVCDGRPIAELALVSKSFGEQKAVWLQVEPSYFVPGFTDQLIGAQAGEKRAVTVQFPEQFPEKALAGKFGTYQVDLLQVKERTLPPLDEAFAQAWGAENLEKLRAGVRVDLENELKYKKKRDLRNQLVAMLLGRVTCDLPESVVQRETKSAIYDIVRANTERGATKEMIDERSNEIYSVASNSAKERVKARIVLSRIAEREGLKASPEEIAQRVAQLAAQHEIKPDRLYKQLQARDALGDIEEEILSAKVLDLLEQHARPIEVPLHA